MHAWMGHTKSEARAQNPTHYALCSKPMKNVCRRLLLLVVVNQIIQP